MYHLMYQYSFTDIEIEDLCLGMRGYATKLCEPDDSFVKIKYFRHGSTRFYWKQRICWWRNARRKKIIDDILRAPYSLRSAILASTIELSQSSHTSDVDTSMSRWMGSGNFK
jgi:hypothetical protein